MPLHRSSFLTTDCNEDHQATLLEKGTYSLALFTNLEQKLQFCKHFATGARKILGILFLLHTTTNQPTSSEYAVNLTSKPLLIPGVTAKKYSKT